MLIPSMHTTLGNRLRASRLLLTTMLFGAVAAQVVWADDRPAMLESAPTTLRLVSGDGQAGVLGEPLEAPLVVQVLDAEGHGVEGVAVGFVAEMGGGRIIEGEVPTDAAGLAQTQWELGPSRAPQSATAWVPGMANVSFRAEVIDLNLCHAERLAHLRNIGRPYRLCESGIIVSSRLVIEPGVTILADPGALITVHGDLVAEGTEAEPIRLLGRVERPGSWRGIWFTHNAKGTLTHVEVAHGGGGMIDKYTPANVLHMSANPVTIRNSLLRDSMTWGIDTSQAYGPPMPGFAANRLEGNWSAGLRMRPGGIKFVDGASTFAGNGENRIEVIGLPSRSDPRETWQETTVPFLLVYGEIRLSNTVVEIEPGFTLIVGNFAERFAVNRTATLRASGTAEKPIRFLAEHEEPGAWYGLEIRSQMDNVLSYVEVAHGGRGSSSNVRLDEGANLSISHSILRDSRHSGLNALRGGALPGFESNRFTGNGHAGIEIRVDQMRYIDSESVFDSNVDDVIEVTAGTIAGEAHRWRGTSVPFCVNGTINVDTELDIEPGFSLLAASGTSYIRVRTQGEIRAVGTAERMIRFMAEADEPGAWRGLGIESLRGNVLSHVEIAHGGQGQSANIQLRGSAAISKSILRDSATVGIDARRARSLEGFAANLFDNNREVGIIIRAEQMRDIDAESRFSGNGFDGIAVEGGELSRGPHVWPRTSAPFLLRRSIAVNIDLAVEPGFSLVADPGRVGITIGRDGSIRAVGTAEHPIRFLSRHGQPGDWQGLRIDSAADNRLEHVEIAYGGSGATHNVHVVSGSVEIVNSLIRDSHNYGLFIQRAKHFHEEGNRFEGNLAGTKAVD